MRTYATCGKKYEYHYVDKWREKTKSGALLFGSAFDKAIEEVLHNREANDREVFDKHWTTQDVNGRSVSLPDSVLVVYAASDFDGDLLYPDDVKWLEAKAKELKLGESVAEAYTACLIGKKQKAYKTWPIAQNKFFNLCNWFSLRRKGHLMLEAHRQKVLPRIKEVVATQKKIELTNDKGDTLLGYIDLIAKWDDGRSIIFDYKTSSIEYEADSVLTGTQLTIYSHSENIKTCGYIVFRKQVLKNKVKICSQCSHDGSGARHKTCANEIKGERCGGSWIETISPEIDIQIIIDDIPERTREIVLESIESTNVAIHNKTFTRNFDSCVQPWGKCPFYSLCFKGVPGDDIEKEGTNGSNKS